MYHYVSVFLPMFPALPSRCPISSLISISPPHVQVLLPLCGVVERLFGDVVSDVARLARLAALMTE